MVAGFDLELQLRPVKAVDTGSEGLSHFLHFDSVEAPLESVLDFELVFDFVLVTALEFAFVLEIVLDQHFVLETCFIVTFLL